MIAGGRLQLGAGSGVVAAFDGIVLLVVGDAAPDRLLAVAREAAQAGDAPGRGLARRLAALLTGDDADAVPAFGALADAGDGLVVFLFGPVAAVAAGDDGTEVSLSGADAATWVDRVLAPGTGPVLLAPEGARPEAVASVFELGSGVVPGGWLRLIPAGSGATAEPATAPGAAAASPAAPTDAPRPAESPPKAARPLVADPVPAQEASPPPPPPPPPPVIGPETADEVAEVADVDETAAIDVAFESFELQPDHDSLREPLPVEAPTHEGAEPEPEPEPEGVDEGDVVSGILCKRQHFNSPLAGYCSSCGISMVHQTHNLVRQKRPPLGFLVFDDGSTFTLDGRYVLGREPDTDALVDSGDARPIMLEDPQMSVSRVHAEIRLVEWDVELVDRGSTNGTHVWDPERGVWDRLSTGEARVVLPGARGAVGQRTFVYESPHRR